MAIKTSPSLRSTMRDAAGKANQSKWGHDGIDVFALTDSGQGFPLDRYPDSEDIIVGKCECGNRLGVLRIADESHIALSCPSNVTALLDDVETLRALLRRACALVGEACDEAETSCPTCSPSEPGQAHIDEIRSVLSAIAKEGDL